MKVLYIIIEDDEISVLKLFNYLIYLGISRWMQYDKDQFMNLYIYYHSIFLKLVFFLSLLIL